MVDLSLFEDEHVPPQARPLLGHFLELFLTKSSMSEDLLSDAKLLKASKIGRYPVQRQRLPSRISSICAVVGDGLSVRRLCMDMTNPGVQNPHCVP